jgi:prepilin-type N-terminal cleavage/methylation domain-containing protein
MNSRGLPLPTCAKETCSQTHKLKRRWRADDAKMSLNMRRKQSKITNPSTKASSQAGFTLVELVVVVVIIGILATMATFGYGKWIGRARRSEAVGMLAEMSSKEVLYFSEFGAYLPLRAGAGNTIDEPPAAFYPISPDDAAFESKRTATSIVDAALWPVQWRSIGMRPRRSELYCTYLLNASPPPLPGPPPVYAAATGTYGIRIMGAATSRIPWFYALAACNFNDAPGLPDNVNVLGVSHLSPMIREWNDGQ